MRFSCAALLLALGASPSSAEESLSYSSADSSVASRRRMDLIGTDPDVDIYYDGTVATCPAPEGTGRRFDAGPSSDPDCANPDNSWDLVFQLDVGKVTVTSCPMDKVLKVRNEDGDIGVKAPSGGPVTEGDCQFLMNTQKDMIEQPQFEDKLSVVAMGAKAMDLLCDWPQWLAFDYTFDMAVEETYQRNIAVHDETSGGLVIHMKPPEKVVYSDCYNSLCFAIGDYVGDANGLMAGKPSMDPACSGETDMLVGENLPLDPATQCSAIPQDANAVVSINWASDDCFGRCGKGCGANADSPNAPSQFTNDCLDYDFCTRFGSDRVWGGDCNNEFLHTIDDTIWSGNCDVNTKTEKEVDPCPDSPVAPTPAPVPTQPEWPFGFDPRPVLVAPVEGKSCTEGCADPAFGNWACTEASLSEQNFRFEEDRVVREALSVGLVCSPPVDTSDGESPTAARVEVDMANPNPEGSASPYPATCVASADNRAGSFDCDAASPAGVYRLCTCYEA